MNYIKTSFILTHVPNPRMNRRISLLCGMGSVSIICVRRKRENIWEPAVTSATHHILEMDYPSSRRPFARAACAARFAYFAFRRLRKDKPTLLYTAGIDNLLISVLYRFFHPRTRIVLEVADVRETFLKEDGGTRRKLISGLEKLLYPKVQLLVLTSEQFYHHYYNRYFPTEKVIVVPNVPDLAAFRDYKRKQGGSFTVGFIGGIRYLKQMKMLVDAAALTGAQVLFAGAGGTTDDMEAITAYCQGKSHVRFTGKYQYDRDIARLYGMVDCVYAVYDADNPNVRIALPNKLYEAAYCGLPLLVARGTYLAEVVQQFGLGTVVSHLDKTELCSAISDLSAGDSDGDKRFVVHGRDYLATISQGTILADSLRSFCA